MMMLIRFLWRESAPLFTVAAIASIANAILLISMVSVITPVLGQTASAPQPPVWAFIYIAGGILIAQTVASVSSNNIVRRLTMRIRGSLVKSVADARFANVEQLGSASITTALHQDALRIAFGLPRIVGLSTSVGFVLAGLVYLWMTSRLMMLLMLAVIVVGTLFVYPFHRRTATTVASQRTLLDKLYRLFQNFADGLKQVKLSGNQRRAVIGRLAELERDMSALQINNAMYLALSSLGAQLLYYLVIGTVIYAPVAQFDAHSQASYLLVVLLMFPPLMSINGTLQSLAEARVSLTRMEGLRGMLGEQAEAGPDDEGGIAPARPAAAMEFELRDATYEYQSNLRRPFTVGPVSFKLRNGECLFIVGGNGSGKTTLAKMIAGLYTPKQGSILVNGKRIEESEQKQYRRMVAAVFSDFCLFEGLSGTEIERHVTAQPELINKLRIDHVFKPDMSFFEQAATLSAGERRRMALLLALLEDRPIYLFDEFAADQDPEFKDVFYREILPELSQRGKIVIVITHDDRYFHCAGRLLMLERMLRPSLVAPDIAAALPAGDGVRHQEVNSQA